MEILEDYLNKHSTKKDDHILWNHIDKITKNPSLCRMLTLSRKLRLPKSSYFPQELLYILKKKELKINTKLIRTCEFENCIEHHEQLQFNITSIEQMESFDYVTACDRFAEHCLPQDEVTKCINWNGSMNPNGYGRFFLCGKVMLAHVAALQLANCKVIPEGLIVRHLCRVKNKKCVFEGHLKFGTHADNTQDEIDGGFMHYGSKCHNVVLSEETAHAIIDSMGNGSSRKERADTLGVSRHHVDDIDNALTWRHLMSPSEIIERENARKKRKKPNLLQDEVREIKESSDLLKTCAKKFNTTLTTISRIRNGKCTSPEIKKTLYFQSTIQRIFDKSLIFEDSNDQSSHLLFKGNKTQDPKEFINLRMIYFGKYESVARVSYMAHHQITSIPDDHIIRHKCSYKCCVNINCLETGTYQDNANDRVRDNTNRKGEANPRTKITNEIAMKIKQTKGVGTRQDRSRFFNVTVVIISEIDTQRTWKHLKIDVKDEILIEKLKTFVQQKDQFSK